jgi:chemotaxis protein methyltransferase CheR
MTFPLSNADFDLVRGYLAETAGLVFDDNRRLGLAGVLVERLRTAGVATIPAYVELLRRGEAGDERGSAERQGLLDAVTVQETHFFRNPPQIQALRRHVLPELLRAAAGRRRPLTIWSAGCSTGEEPYTLAMLLLELSPMLAGRSGTRIVGTDVSEQALRTARRAMYAGRTLDTAPALLLDRWFEPRSGGARAVREEVTRLVDLRLHNLVTDPPPFGPGEVDLVLCRNVTIYFARDTTRALMGRFHDVLADDGYLLLGHSETLWQVSDDFALAPVDDAFLYRRAAGRPDQAGPTQPPASGGAGTGGARRPKRLQSAGPAGPVEVTTPTELVEDRTPAVPVEHRTPAVPVDAAGPAEPVEAAGAASAERLRRARQALAAGDYRAAERLAGQVCLTDPLEAEAYVVRGQALATLGLDTAAADVLRKAVYLAPAAGHAHFLLAGSLARLGQHGPAAVSYRAAAGSLESVDPGSLAAILGGRAVGELVDLCRRLAAVAADAGPGPRRSAAGG